MRRNLIFHPKTNASFCLRKLADDSGFVRLRNRFCRQFRSRPNRQSDLFDKIKFVLGNNGVAVPGRPQESLKMKLIPFAFDQNKEMIERGPSGQRTVSLFEHDDLCDCSEKSIATRANTITPVLEDILSKLNAFPHGGINE